MPLIPLPNPGDLLRQSGCFEPPPLARPVLDHLGVPWRFVEGETGTSYDGAAIRLPGRRQPGLNLMAFHELGHALRGERGRFNERGDRKATLVYENELDRWARSFLLEEWVATEADRLGEIVQLAARFAVPVAHPRIGMLERLLELRLLPLVCRTMRGRRSARPLYVKTETWRNRRTRYFSSHHHCEAPNHPRRRAVVVHHTRYGSIGFEPDEDLMALCDLCHGRGQTAQLSDQLELDVGK